MNRQLARCAPALGLALVIASAASLAVPARPSAATGGRAPSPTARLVDGQLRVTGDRAADVITLRMGGRNRLDVDVRDDGTADFRFDIRLITTIVLDGGEGNDTLRIDVTSGSFTDMIPTTISGGAGDDVLIGGQFAETFLGGDGQDWIEPGIGDDLVGMGPGDDRLVWSVGNGSDTVDGEDGVDVLEMSGAVDDDSFFVRSDGSGGAILDRGGRLTLRSMDTVAIASGDGNDTFRVGDLSGSGTSRIEADGGDGTDLVQFVGTPANVADEQFTVSADGAHVRLALAPNTVVIDAVTVEQVDLATWGGNDTVVVDDLAGTDVNLVELDRLDPAGVFSLFGTAGDDSITASSFGSTIQLIGLRAAVRIGYVTGGAWTVSTGEGDDVVLAGGVKSGLGDAAIVGGPGDDVLGGTAGNDVLAGDAGSDVLMGNGGSDVCIGGEILIGC